jgi:hypothetical protein
MLAVNACWTCRLTRCADSFWSFDKINKARTRNEIGVRGEASVFVITDILTAVR